jgi:two-component system, NtrC family, C4-dicarboxylate transport sensor histidine kinase DctB
MSNRQGSPDGVLNRRAWRVWAVFGLVVVAVSVTVLYAVGLYGRDRALDGLLIQGRNEAGLKVALLRAVLERPRTLPLLLARDLEVAQALKATDMQKRTQLSRKLEELVADTGAAVVYVLGSDGVAIASSNWREPTSFVGSNYAFRPYFSRAMQEGTAEYFALGSVSLHPGLYLSRRIGPATAPLGVVVAKMEFDQLESTWSEMRRATYVVDENHVVLITSLPSWRFMTSGSLPQENVAAIRESLQFGDAPLAALPLQTQQPLATDAMRVRAVLPGSGAEDYLRISLPVASTPWQFEYLVPVAAPLAAAAREARLVAILILACGFAILAILLWRRQQTLARMTDAKFARDELERRVTERTRDLTLVRDRLEWEMADHRATEERLQVVQQDLVQANRLAILGQVAAGVAHEINQPVATIRAYADNSKVFLERDQTGPVLENLGLIAGLTERIGAITEDLKALARRGRTPAGPVLLLDVFDGAVLLLRSRYTGRLERLVIAPPPEGLQVMGNRLRLEQVFINLFQNALEATDGLENGMVTVSTVMDDDRVTIQVSDNGPGIEQEVLAAMFSPFNSSKEKGLGLGLVISRDIVTDYGGHIAVETSAAGANFLVQLRKAPV